MGNELSTFYEYNEKRGKWKVLIVDLNGREISNYARTALGLKLTIKATFEVTETRMKKEYSNWSDTEKEDFGQFCEAVKQPGFLMFHSTKERKQKHVQCAWELSRFDAKSDRTMRQILNLHTNPKSPNIQWDCKGDQDAEEHWILAKMFMPFGNKGAKNIEETDPLALLDLFRNCKLFKDIDRALVDELCDIRNNIMHDGPTQFSDSQTKAALETMKKFMDLDVFKESVGKQEISKSVTKLKGGSVMLNSSLIDTIRNILPDDVKGNNEQLYRKTTSLFKKKALNLTTELKKEIQQREKELKEIRDEKARLKSKLEAIGAIAGAAATGTAATGAAAGTATVVGLLAGATLSAPVVIPAVIACGLVGSVATWLGFRSGKKGGSTASEVDKIE